MQTKIIIHMLCLILTFIYGCSIFRAAPLRDLKGDDVVLVLYKEKSFKNEVIGQLTKALAEKGYTVVTGNNKQRPAGLVR